MTKEELLESKKRKENMKLYSIHEMLTSDLLFYYSVEVLLLTQVKNITMQEIILAVVIYRMSKVLLQIPVNLTIEKIGLKNGVILGDILIATSIIIIIIGENFATLALANMVMAYGFLTKSLSSDLLLTKSVPQMENQNNLLAKIYGKGMGNYYYLAAITSMIAGFLYKVNCYLPLIISSLFFIIAAKLACSFNKIDNTDEKNVEEKLTVNFNSYLYELKNSFNFIIDSRRLRSLMIYAGLIFGIIVVIDNYQINLLDEVGVSSEIIGIIYAIMQICCGIAAKKQHQFHNKFKNKSLTVIGLVFVISCFIAGIVSVLPMPIWMITILIAILYSIRYCSIGLYHVLIKKYISNFTTEKIVGKVYTAYNLITSISSCIVGVVATIIISKNDIRESMIIFGLLASIAMLLVLRSMRNKVGLKPEQYKKEEISYREYIKSKKS